MQKFLDYISSKKRCKVRYFLAFLQQKVLTTALECINFADVLSYNGALCSFTKILTHE